MTHRTDVARARDIVARWSALAEQRLDYLTELYETGRWRRYHSEHEFLENIREAKGAVATWRGLLDGEATADNRPVDISWIGRSKSVALAKLDMPIEPAPAIVPQLPERRAIEAAPVSAMAEMAEPEATAMVAPDAALETPEPEAEFMADPVKTPRGSALDRTLALTLDIVAMAERYPLLRNVFQSNR
ncbi:MAG: TIGR03809 family protein [Bradyrhizobium sp.]|nr:TIGR03809 family protein [Bradyrhizobium sp.]